MAFKILKDFAGSPDGRYVVNYKAGDTVDLTPSLAAVAVKEKWAKEIAVKAKPDPEAEAAAAKAAAIADCEARLAAAAEADKPGIEAELAQLKAPE